MKRLVSTALTLGLVVAVTAALAMPAQGHAGEKTIKATDLIKQGIAFIVEVPDDPSLALDKMKDALDSMDQSGVYLDYVKQAITAEKAGDTHKARALLEASIGAKPHMSGVDPAPIGQLSGPLAVGAEPGASIANDPLQLTAQFTGGNLALLAASLIAVVLGGWMAIRMRPRRRQEANS
jgi:hypothetical protein